MTTSTKNQAASFGFAGARYRPGVMAVPHQHQEVELNYLTGGGMTYLAAGRLVRVPARRLVVFWGGAPHQVIATREAPEFYCFTIPFAWVLQWRLARAFNEALLRGHVMVDDAVLDDEGRLERWCEDLRRGDAEHLRIAQLEMEACLRRLIVRSPRPTARAGRAPAGRMLAVQTMAEFITRNYSGRLTVAEIVAPTGLHPNYAMSLFRETCGLSILDYLIEHRLFHARRLLATTDMKVLDVAMESGFGSLSRFNEAFARANGCAPRAYRRRLAGA